MESKTYVGLLYNGRIQYVTHMDARTREAYWRDGYPAKPLSRSAAENLYTGLRYNGFKAVVITMPAYEEPRNEGEA